MSPSPGRLTKPLPMLPCPFSPTVANKTDDVAKEPIRDLSQAIL